MALFSKKNLKRVIPFGLTEKDLIGEIKDFPMGVVVRMVEEQEAQDNKPDVKVFQNDINTGKDIGGFKWRDTEAGYGFWSDVINFHNFERFFKKYSSYIEL